MPSNERINKRKEKKRQRDKKIKTVVYGIIIAVAAALLIMKACEFNVDSFKQHFASATTVSEAYPIKMDIQQEGKMDVVNDKLAVLTDNSLSVITPSSAKLQYTFDHGYANPFVKYAGNYICMYDQSGTRLRLDTTQKPCYERVLDKSIITAAVSKNGTVAYATLGDKAKSHLVVMNSSEIVKLDINVKSGYITSIALSENGKKCAYTTVNSVNSFLQTTVHIINVDAKKDTKTFDLTGVNVFDMHYTNTNDFYIIGDNMLAMVKNQKNLVQIIKQGGCYVSKYAYTTNNELVVEYSEYENATTSKLAYINSKGKIKNSFDINGTIKYLSTNQNEITALFSDKIVVYSLNRDKIKNTSTCENGISSVHSLASKNYVLKGHSVDALDKDEK